MLFDLNDFQMGPIYKFGAANRALKFHKKLIECANNVIQTDLYF